MNRIYVAVFTNQDRTFDEFGRGYLPLFHSVFGIYEDMWDAISAVSKFLYSDNKEYDVLENNPCSDGEGRTIGYTWTFRYEDKSTGAFGLYEIEVSTEFITQKASAEPRYPMKQSHHKLPHKHP